MKISIIIPAYNEEKRIGRTLKAYSEFFNKNIKKPDTYQLLIVINGTRDNTESVVKEYQKKYKQIKYLNFKKGGKGFAINEGFKESLKDFDIIGFVDADLATSPEEYWKLIKCLEHSDVAIADRYSPGSTITPAHSFKRKVISKVYNFMVRVIFFLNLRDTQCGAKVFKRKVIEKILPDLDFTNWAYDINLIYSSKKKGFKIISMPTNWTEVSGGHLNVIKTSIQMAFALIQLRILKSHFKNSLKVISPIIGIIYKLIK